jgi:putative DNA primase/helicase
VNKPFDPKTAAAAMVLETYGSLGGPLLTEDSCALAFAEQYKDRLRYDHNIGQWFVWNGTIWGIWRENSTALAFQYAREVARRMAASELKDQTRFIASKTAFAAGVERFCKSDPQFAVTAAFWNPDPWLLGTTAGTVSLRTGSLSLARPGDAISKSTSVGPNETANCPRFKKFLDETFSQDSVTIRFVQQFLGYCLTGDTSAQVFSFGHGDGGNGKGVLLNTASEILGDYAVQATMESLTASKTPQHSTDLAMLSGARFVTASETERGRQWAEKTLCALTGGDKITARFMRQDNFTFVPQFKLFIIGNHLPRLASVNDAMRRRLRLIPFLNKPNAPDESLMNKLKEEHPAILRWMIDGCLDWQKNGFVKSDAIIAKTEDYFQEEDLFGQWLAEECDLEPGNPYKNATSADLFTSFRAFLTRRGQNAFEWNSTSFGLELAKYAEKKRTREGISWLGVALKRPRNWTGEER